MDRVLRPAAANRTIRARFKSRCIVTGERQHASSTLRSFRERWTSLASGIIPILNHDSPSKKRGTSSVQDNAFPGKPVVAFALAALADWLFYGQRIGISALLFAIALAG